MKNNNEVRGCLIERKGRYYVIVSYYEDGRRTQETRSTGIAINAHKKREVEQIMEKLVREKERELEQLAHQQASHSFADCMRRWVAYKSSQIECTTAWGYEARSKSVIEYFEKKKTMIEDLQPKDLLAYYEWALEHGRRNTNSSTSGLKRRTVSDQAVLIKSFLNDAVVQGVIASNPADKVIVPRVKESNTEEKAFMDEEQSTAFLNFIKSEPLFEKLYCITKLGLYYGFRRSEILGLKWSAINWDKGEIVIDHTVVRGINGTEYRDNVKTPSSHRYMPLLKIVKDDLQNLMEKQKELGIYSSDGYVFKWDDGRMYDPDYITKLFKKAVLRCDAVSDNLTFHGLRHSCCALLFEKGWDLGKVQNWLGHSDVTLTANVYNHVNKKWRNKHGDMIDEMFG